MLKHLARWFQGPGARHATHPAKPQVRLRVKRLEDRLVPTTFNVNSLADLSLSPGVNTATGAITGTNTVTLRSAIQAANATPGGNTINLNVAGTYKITLVGTAGETDNAAGEFAILPAGGNLTILNNSGGTAIVDGNHLNRVFDINPANTATAVTVTMQGFTIQNGVVSGADPAGSGGGIRDQGPDSLTLTNMIVTNNSANADGGGLSMANPTASTAWTLTLNASTISNNHASDAGGGVETDGTGTVNINAGSVITGNSSVNEGGGVWLDTAGGTATATLTVTGTLVSNNKAGGDDGGIGNGGSGAVIINSSTISNNSAGGSGGGYGNNTVNGTTLAVSSSIFIGNSASSGGGGGIVENGGTTTMITNTYVANNSSSGNGGGLFDKGTTLTVQGSTFANNTTNVSGGGITVETTGTGAAGSKITNTTITGNSAFGGNNGGGINAPAGTFTGSLALLNDTINANFAANGGGVFWAGTTGSVTVQNTIIAGNTATTGPDADNPAGTFTDSGGNLIGVSGTGSGNTGFTAGTTQTGTVGTPLNPLLGPLQNNGGPTVGAPGNTGTLNTEALQPGSPALDLGVAAGAPTTDERGFGRPDNGEARPDIGAFETQDVTGNAAFVEALYRDFLHRLGNLTNPNDAGQWVNLLNAGALTPQQVANGISQSPEALGIVVDGLYLKILQRPSDPTGRAGFVSLLESGGTVEQVIAGLLTSPEYAALTGSDSGFVMGLYNVLLGRTGSSAEVAGYVSVLPTIGRAAVVSAFLNSPEYRMDEVEQLYGVPLAALTSVASVFPDLLHRATVSAAEIAGWVNSGLGILQLEMAFAGSAEYIALAPVFSGGVFV